MPIQVAFLRAINVGGRNVKMKYLRGQFEAMGFTGVRSFIASGNIIFESDINEFTSIERKIESHLEDTLGFKVTTFVRTAKEIEDLLEYTPFGTRELEREGNKLYIGFTKEEPQPDKKDKLLDLRNEVDDFDINGREVYWLRRTAVGNSDFSGSVLEKTIEMPATMRTARTVKRVQRKFL